MGSAVPARDSKPLSRRDLLRTAAATGAGLALSSSLFAQEGPAPDDINIAMIGTGSQGRTLMISLLKIPGVRFKAVCDVWPYHQKYGAGILKKYDQPVNVYSDYRDMLASENDLDAVFIATPDWVHAEQAVACLNAGLHVYCEKEMSNTLDGARQMVLAARKTGKLLQTGHQRRSNPRYIHAEDLIREVEILGRPTHVYGQWNRARRIDLGWPKKYVIDDETLKKYGYDTMERFRNWRRYRKFSGGAIADLGSHQIDVFNWFLHAQPEAVIASAGLDYYTTGEWYDNVMATYEYKTATGTVRGFYQVLNTTSYGGYYEAFMGDEGTLEISEDPRRGHIFREVLAERKDWEDDAARVDKMGQEAIELKIGETRKARGAKGEEAIEKDLAAGKPIHTPHLENFIDAIRGKAKLTCPPEVAYETAVSVLAVNRAVQEARRIEFDPDEFKV